MISLIKRTAIFCVAFALLTMTTIPVMSVAAPIARYHGYSYNWSGYAIVAGGEIATSPSGNKYWIGTAENPIYSHTISYVYGEWIVPTIKPGTTGYMADVAIWVGIDGYDSNTVEQIGTDSEYNPSTGEVTYSAWWEVYPKFSHPIRAMTVNAGDHIVAYVKFIPEGNSNEITDRGIFELSLTDTTTGNSFTIRQGPLEPDFYQRSSAEWIVERPAFYNPSTKQVYFAELPEFEPIVFTRCQSTIMAPSGVNIHYDRMFMVAPLPSVYGYGDAYGTSTARYTIAKTNIRSGNLISGGSFTVMWISYGTQLAQPWPWKTPEGRK